MQNPVHRIKLTQTQKNAISSRLDAAELDQREIGQSTSKRTSSDSLSMVVGLSTFAAENHRQLSVRAPKVTKKKEPVFRYPSNGGGGMKHPRFTDKPSLSKSRKPISL